ncbi:MAG: NADH-quinone oxidoreductase subunit J [Candidatus Sumerlaeia bacterium]|nr:NADH-quinone oxidoreductase subunit J [Candidatus Sumerlaeia bacterium]
MGFDLIYTLLYILTLVSGILVLTLRDTVKSAMALVLLMLSLACHYFYMGQEFIGAIQIIVYAGAIMVLFLFVIMLLNVREQEITPWYLRNSRYMAGVFSAVFFLILAFGISVFGTDDIEGFSATPPSIVELSTLLTTKYFLPFILTSVLLLVAVIGAVVMGRRFDPETGEEYIPEDIESAS